MRLKTNKKYLLLIGLLLTSLLLFDAISGFNYGGTGNRLGYQVTLFLLVTTQLLFFIFHQRGKKPIVILILMYLSIFIGLFNLKSIIAGNQDIRIEFAYSLLWGLLSFSGFKLTYSNNNLVYKYKSYFYLLFAISLVAAYLGASFYSSEFDVMLTPGIYTVLVFLPWIQIQKDSWFKKLTTLILISFVLLSFKRGAIIVLITCLLLNEFVKYLIGTRIIYVKKTIRLFVGIALIIFLLLYIDGSSEGVLSSRFKIEELKDGSGRANSNSIGLNALLTKSNFYTVISGFSMEEPFLRGYIGHNDWLSFILRYGIVGVTLYATLFICILSNLRFLIKEKQQLAIPYSTVFLIMFFMSFFSTSYGATIHPVFTMLFLGYCEGINKYKAI